jgi:hypothetical protein
MDWYGSHKGVEYEISADSEPNEPPFLVAMIYLDTQTIESQHVHTVKEAHTMAKKIIDEEVISHE